MADELRMMLMRAKPGEVVEYWRGFLAFDRCFNTGFYNRAHLDVNSAAHQAGEMAMSLEAQGMVELVQRRHGPMDYSYLAVKCGVKPKPRTQQSIVAEIRRNAGRPRGVAWAR